MTSKIKNKMRKSKKFRLGVPKKKVKKLVKIKYDDTHDDKYLPKWMKNKIETDIISIMGKLSDEEILSKVKGIVFTNNPSDRTITWRYSLIKKKLKPRVSTELAEKIKPDKKITEKVLKENIKVRDNRKMKPISQELIEKIISFGKSNNPYEMYIYVMFVTGRRLREVIDGKFTNKKGSKNISMKGIKKSRKKELDDEIIEIIPLVAKTKFFRVYNKLIKIIKYSNIKHIENNLQRCIKKLLGPEFKSHDLRRLYAMYMFKFRNKDKETINPFLKKILHHSSIENSINYTDVELQFNKDIVK